MAGSVILHHGVGLEYVGTDLVAPADFLHLSTNAGKLLRVFLLLEHIQLRLQHLHGLILVLELGSLVLALHHDSGRKVGNTDGGGRLVDVLSACAAASVGIDPQILIVDLHVQILFDVRHDIQRHKGSLPFSLGVEGRDSHQTVHALFRLEIAVGVFPVHLKGDGFDARLIAVQIIQDLYAEALFLGPSGIHAVEHAAPVAALRSARTGVQFQNRIVFIILSRQKSTDTQRLKLRRKGIQLAADLLDHAFILFLIPHLNQGFNVLILGFQTIDLIHCILEIFQLLHLLIGIIGVIPEAGSLHFPLQLFDLLRLFSEVKVNPSLPLMEFCKTVIPASSDQARPLRITTFSFFKPVMSSCYLFLPQQFLYFLPLPQGQGSLG